MILEVLLSSIILSSNVTTNRITITPGISSVERTQQELQREAEDRRRLVTTQSPALRKAEGVEEVYKDPTNNCVKWSLGHAGISIVGAGLGGRKAINSQTPAVGVVGVQKSIYHAVYIEKIDGDNLTILESNYEKNWITRRVLPRSEFLGFIYPQVDS